jgi:RNA polymerase sigma factor (sigma-70 family)
MTMPLPPFQHLVDAYWPDVSRLARARAGANDGDDVAQQAWTQAYAAYPAVRSATNLRGWLLTITHRCAMDAHRSRARRPIPTPDEVLPEPTAGSAGPGEATPDGELWALVARLPQRQREAVVLRYVADFDHAGIAATLGVTLTTSRRLVSDGLATLRRDYR